ncbi:hypothetical protein BJF86_15590 [Serinicoccus sp. CNJ-927]|uniref:hypothetical protein n=1 Tax=Serinicoccus sp. CNJ-927 TaxID=1904970 RepID=UPI00095B80B7|nr:hypothetical protein [Serinicoccus sp. CNJ-927]OLT41595.1 hypothetical protein BJF86_15590 [Serinicoccus sp. CNJ-927]
MGATRTVLLYPRTVRSWRAWLFGRVSQMGFTLGLVMLWVALSPSLLPLIISVVVWWWSVRQQASNAELVGLDTGGNAGTAVGVAGGVGLGVLLVVGRPGARRAGDGGGRPEGGGPRAGDRRPGA